MTANTVQKTWRKIVAKYQQPDTRKSIWQLVNSFGLYVIAWVLMVTTKEWDFFTHFYNPKKSTPDWAAELRGVRPIGNHKFGFIN